MSVTPDDAIAVTLAAQPAPLYHGETARVVDDLKRWSGEGWSIALVFEGTAPPSGRSRCSATPAWAPG